MRIRILKSMITVYGNLEAGVITDIPDKTAMDWCQKGLAMQDKSLDGGNETKGNPPIGEKSGNKIRRKTKGQVGNRGIRQKDG